MRPHEIENWALKVIASVISKQPVEDVRVELKSDWGDPAKIARRLAAHSNTAHGAEILWLIGVDEKSHSVPGVIYQDLANWLPQVQSCFDGISPSCTPVNVPVSNGEIVVALLIETDRAPFVVNNPSGGAIEKEVPWRDGTRTRSANRTELLQILSPLQTLPSMEILGGNLLIRITHDLSEIQWDFDLCLYVVPSSTKRVTIPYHRCSVVCELPAPVGRANFQRIRFSPKVSYQWGKPEENRTGIMQATDSEIIIDGPGKLFISARKMTTGVSEVKPNIPIDVTIGIANASMALHVSENFIKTKPWPGESDRWEIPIETEDDPWYQSEYF